MTFTRFIGLVAAAAVGAAATLPAQVPSDDSSFVLSSDDPARAPSPFIGNGRIGLVIPALGLGPAESYVAGLYEEAPGDVPRIAGIPVWIPLGVCHRAGCLDSTAVARGQLQGYHQSLDLRSGTARTEYDWVSSGNRVATRVESFVSRADGRTGATRLELTPAQAGRYHVRFALAGRAAPRRLALGRIERADPAWRPPDIWYPGHMTVRSRRVTLEPNGARLDLTATPGRTRHPAESDGTDRLAGQSGGLRGAAGGRGRLGAGRGQLRRAAPAALRVHPDRDHDDDVPGDDRCRLTRLLGPARRRQRGGVGEALDHGHPDRGQPGAAAGGALDALLPAGQRGRGHRAGRAPDGALQRRLLRPHLLGLRTPWMFPPVAAPGCPRSGCPWSTASPTLPRWRRRAGPRRRVHRHRSSPGTSSSWSRSG